jgi:cyclohexadienyl dehydratase
MLDPAPAAKVHAREKDPMRNPLQSVCLLAHPALMIALAMASSEAQPLHPIVCDHTLKVGMTGDHPPFSLRSADGRMSGADVTIARELAKALELELEIVPTTWRTIQPDLQADRYDVVMGALKAAVDAWLKPIVLSGR